MSLFAEFQAKVPKKWQNVNFDKIRRASTYSIQKLWPHSAITKQPVSSAHKKYRSCALQI